MDRDTAANLEGMMLASRAQLEHIADFVRTQVPAPQQRTIMLKVAAALTEPPHGTQLAKLPALCVLAPAIRGRVS